MALPPIVAHMVRLATGLHVRVHAGRRGHRAAVEIRVRHLVQNRIVDAGRAGNLAEVLALWFALLLDHDDWCLMLVVVVVLDGCVVHAGIVLFVVLRLLILLEVLRLLVLQFVQILLVMLRLVDGTVLLQTRVRV